MGRLAVMRAGVGLAVGFAVSCGGSSPANRPTTTRMMKSDQPMPERGGQTLPLWLVEVGVSAPTLQAGHPTMAIVDTGARTTVIDRQFAEEHGLVVESSNVVAKDFAGTELETWIVRDVTVSFGAWSTRRVNAVVLELPALFRNLGIGVIWSPQTSVPEGGMLRVSFTDGTLEVLAASELAPGAATLCEGPAAEVPNTAALIDATLAGHPVRLELDSGATAVSLSAASAAGTALLSLPEAASGQRMGAGGAIQTIELPPQPIVVAGEQLRAPLSVSPASESASGPCASDGEIGLEVLKHCTLDLTATHFELRCQHQAR